MKKSLILILCCFVCSVFAQQTTVNYSINNADILNPERGFYRYTATYGSSPNPLSATFMNQLRQNENISLIFRYVFLDNFLTGPISNSFLTSIENDFAVMRQTGVKVILRFAYSETYTPNPPHNDGPTKPIVMQHIEQLKPYIQQNTDVILTLQNGFYGTWGENFYSDAFGCECNGPLTAQNWADRKEVSDSLLAILPADRLLSVRYPRLKTEVYASSIPGGYSIPNDSLSYAEAYSGSLKSRIGYHNDCFLVAANDYTFSNTATEKPFWETESRYTIMGGETCGDDPTYTNCPNALIDLENAHWTYLNDGYEPNVLDRWVNEGCMPEIVTRLGYRIHLIDGTYDNQGTPGGSYDFSINLSNTGFASIVNPRPLIMVFDNGSQSYEVPINLDVRRWYAGGNYTIDESLVLPSNMTPGTYDLYLYLPDAAPSISGDPDFAVQLANLNMWQPSTGWNDLQMQVSVLATGSPNMLADDNCIQILSDPSNSVYTVTGDLSNYDICIVNAAGQTVQSYSSLTNFFQIDASLLSFGLHFILVKSKVDSDVYVQKIIKF